MKSSIPNSNSVILNWKEWLITITLFLIIGFGIYFGWYRWEQFKPDPDYRSTCWEQRMSDYWAYARWTRYAQPRYKILMMGDSVFWGQEVRNDETISHFMNVESGKENFANLGIDGFTCAAMDGMMKYYSQYIHDTNVILQMSPLWISSTSRDMRGDGTTGWNWFFYPKPQDMKKDWKFHHPLLVPQLSPRIHYYKSINERLGYLFEHRSRLLPFVHHLMVEYYDNKSITSWVMANPYKNPLSTITFKAAPMMADKQGLGTDWASRQKRGIRLLNDPWLNLDESVMWNCYVDALKRLKNKKVNVFVLIGPYNTYNLTPESREKFFATIVEVKKRLDALGFPYFDSTQDLLPSNTYADQCHALKEGHALLAKDMFQDTKFKQWIAGKI
jgi:hypothetical protein